MNPGNDMSRVGDIAELRACVWLSEEGYEVFRNISASGPVDIVAVKDGEVLLIDVKVVTFYDRGSGSVHAGRAGKLEGVDITLLYWDKRRDQFHWGVLPAYIPSEAPVSHSNAIVARD